MAKNPERRSHRSDEIFQALGLQLQACWEDAGLHAILLSDDDGLCLAFAGPRETCDELAARLPILGRKVGDFQGVLLHDGIGLDALVQRFRVEAAGQLYMCALGGSDELRTRQIARSINGCARILAAA